MNRIKESYIECALWSSIGKDGEPIEGILSEEARIEMETDVDKFMLLLEKENIDRSEWTDEELGHDFWLSRNGHGTGFWDRGKSGGDILHKLAKSFGEVYLYEDSGFIYHD